VKTIAGLRSVKAHFASRDHDADRLAGLIHDHEVYRHPEAQYPLEGLSEFFHHGLLFLRYSPSSFTIRLVSARASSRASLRRGLPLAVNADRPAVASSVRRTVICLQRNVTKKRDTR
jgi:hypothetical protein